MASMRKKGKGGHYYARFYDSSRSPKRKEIPLGTTRKSVARQHLTDLERKYEKGEFDPWTENKPENLSLVDAIQSFLEDKEGSIRDSTLEGYRSKLEHFEREHAPLGIMLADLGEKPLRSYVHASGIKQSTKAMRFRHLRVFLNWCVKAGHIDRSPLDGLNKPKSGEQQAPFLKPQHVEKLLTTIDAHHKLREEEPGPTPDDDWLKNMIKVAIGTGLRRGELINLRWQDIDLEDRRIYVRNREDFSTKSRHERTVPLRGDALTTLREMYAGRTEDIDGTVFTDVDGKPLKPDRVTKRFKFYVRKAKLKDRERISFHNLRHTTGSWLAMQGVPMRVISEILGHSNTQVTERYSHLSPDVLDQAMEETFGA